MSDPWLRKQQAYERRQKLRAQVVAFMGGKCAICGYDRSSAAFDFHHLNPAEKDFTISDRMTSFEAIRPELEKCVLLCCRCHREVHDGWHPSFIVHDQDGRSQLDPASDVDLLGPEEDELPPWVRDA